VNDHYNSAILVGVLIAVACLVTMWRWVLVALLVVAVSCTLIGADQLWGTLHG